MNEDKKPRRTPLRRDARETRARLLTEAGKAFAEHGFEGSNLRDICRAARVNLGAIKYYFGSKKELYREVLIQSHIEIINAEPPPRIDQTGSPEEALRAWIVFILRLALLRRKKHPYLSRLMIREIVNPSFALDELVEKVFKGVREQLSATVLLLTADGRDRRSAEELTNIIIMLCVQQEMGRSIFERAGFPPPESEQEVSELAGKIHRFVSAGIRTWAETAPAAVENNAVQRLKK